MGHARHSWTTRLGAAAVVLALGGLVGCGAGASDQPSDGASPSSRVSPGADETAAVRTPEDREAPGGPEAAALAFIDFAAGGAGGEVPWAASVDYRIGGEEVATLTSREAARRGAWSACPPEESTYEGRDCPVSALRSLAQLERDGAPVQVEAGWPRTVGCSRVDPAEVGSGSAVSLRPPPQRRDCFSDVGVLLRVDDDGRVDLVELVLSGA